ncbi:hypothetical protein Tco_1506546 [Tanacetum coccineum]
MEGNVGRLFLGRDWESSLTGLELVQETIDKVVLVKEKLKAVRDRQKSYVNYRRKPLEFEVGNHVLLKVTSWKGVVRFVKKGKISTEESVENSDREVMRQFLFDELRGRVVNDVVTQLKGLTSFLDDRRGSACVDIVWKLLVHLRRGTPLAIAVWISVGGYIHVILDSFLHVEQEPPSPNFLPGPEHPPSLDYVPVPEYLEYLVPSDDEDEEEEEHLALVNSTTLPAIDLVPSVEDTKAFKTDESAPTPPSPRLRRARISVRPQTLMAAATEALIAAIPSPPLPLLSPPLLLPTPSSPLLLPATDRREDVPEADVPPRKRLCLTAPALRFEVGESSAAAAARQHRLGVTHATDYGFVDTDDMVGDIEEKAPTTLEELSQRVTDLVVTLARDTHEMYVRFEDVQDDRALQRARVNMLFRERRYHLHIVMLLESEVKSLHEQISVLQRQRNEDNDRLTQHIHQGYDRTREPEPARDPDP